MKRRNKKNSLRSFILREARKLQRESFSGKLSPVDKVKAREVGADEYADTLEKDLDYIKALKIKEGRLNRQHRLLARRMKKLQEMKKRLRRKVIKSI
tara:strand:+ start:68 stop:358 length:291 start_codon:yes stop_codon:yes gene_type:complete